MSDVEQHRMVSHHQAGVAGWIDQCRICGEFDLTEHDRLVRAEALREAADVWGEMRRGNNTPDGEAWLRARAEQVQP